MEILLFTDVKEAIRFLRKAGRNRVLQVIVLADIEKPQVMGGIRKNYNLVVAAGLVIPAPSRSSAHGEHTSKG
ncbi:hypothetical protein [Pyrodictium abyssi]|uniref:Uncharacterized protein n=1 Tax=Pyrodictium abyssi TaxID=54256 RepID=A0ABN6ZLV6_9CREN|nr:hypothetical protein PABY_08230 [Pyrodictium abyssi]